MIADPPAQSDATRVSSYRNLLTKTASRGGGGGDALPLQDVCYRLLKQQDDVKATTKLALKQCMVHANRRETHFRRLRQSHDLLRSQLASSKQSWQSQNTQLQQELKITRKKLEEKTRQVEQFQNLHSHIMVTPTSTSATGNSRGNSSTPGSGPPFREGAMRGHHNHAAAANNSNTPHNHGRITPFKSFAIQQEAQEMARQRAAAASPRPMLGLAGPSSHGSNNPYSRGPGGRTSNHSGYHSSGSVGSGGSNGRNPLARSPISSTAYGNSDKRRRPTMSPSQAFGVQPVSNIYGAAHRHPSNGQYGGGGGHRHQSPPRGRSY